MTTYTTIANSQIDLDSPITEPLMTALRDNPIAIAEGSTGAPKIADSMRHASGDEFGGASISTLNVGEGVRAHVYVNLTVATEAQETLEFEVSEDGTTWTNTTTIFTTGTGESDSGDLVFVLDFSTGVWRAVGRYGGTVFNVGGTLTSAEDTAYIRFQSDANPYDVVVMGFATGGIAAS